MAFQSHSQSMTMCSYGSFMGRQSGLRELTRINKNRLGRSVTSGLKNKVDRGARNLLGRLPKKHFPENCISYSTAGWVSKCMRGREHE